MNIDPEKIEAALKRYSSSNGRCSKCKGRGYYYRPINLGRHYQLVYQTCTCARRKPNF
jgi:excinuclease UvrABC ATPase subunit